MIYSDKIKNLIDQVDVGEPIFKIEITPNEIYIRDQDWSVYLGDGFYEQLVSSHIMRCFDRSTKQYTINYLNVQSGVVNSVLRNIMNIYTECSPNLEPRKTKGYKLFQLMYRLDTGTKEFIDSVFGIAEYYHSVTKTDSIKSTINDIHRKNIFQLLTLMERKYGKKASNK